MIHPTDIPRTAGRRAPVDLLVISCDDAGLTRIVDLLPSGKGYEVTGIAGYDAIASLAEQSTHVVTLLDIGEGDSAALALLERLAGERPGTPVIVLHSSSDDAIEAATALLGAADCLGISEATPLLLDHAIRHALTFDSITGELHRVRSQMDAVINHVPVVFFTIDRGGIFTASGGKGLAQLGVGPNDAIGRSVFEVYRDEPRILKNIVRALSGETFTDVVTVGGLVYECGYVPTRDADGTINGLMGIATDLTPLAREEGERRRVEERYRAIWDSAVDAILLLDSDGVVVEANPSFFSLCGYVPEEVIGRSFAVLFPEELREHMLERYQVFFTGEPTRQAYEFTINRKDGEEKIVEGHVNFIEHDSQRTLMLALIRDITERKRIEQALRESEEHFRLLTENALDIITVLRSDGTIVYESPALERVVGFKPEEIVGQNAFSYIHPEDLPDVLEVFLEAIKYHGRSAGAEFRFLTNTGDWCYLESIGTNLIDHPVIQGVVLNSRDVTARKMAEEALREANERLETRVQERTAEIVEVMGRLEQAHATQKRFIADASHDLRTPLTVIGIEADLLLETEGFDEMTRESLERIKNETVRLSNLASDLLLLATLDSPPSIDVFQKVRFDEFLLELVKQMTSLANDKKISWNVQVEGAIDYRCDVRMMESALKNVLENAIKYSNEGSVIGVSLRCEGDAIAVSIADQGIGIPVEDLDKVFERFYRSDTARSTPGTGLGLAIVKGVVDAHGGNVKLDSRPGLGTTLTMLLPRAV